MLDHQCLPHRGHWVSPRGWVSFWVELKDAQLQDIVSNKVTKLKGITTQKILSQKETETEKYAADCNAGRVKDSAISRGAKTPSFTWKTSVICNTSAKTPTLYKPQQCCKSQEVSSKAVIYRAAKLKETRCCQTALQQPMTNANYVNSRITIKQD